IIPTSGLWRFTAWGIWGGATETLTFQPVGNASFYTYEDADNGNISAITGINNTRLYGKTLYLSEGEIVQATLSGATGTTSV
ncbi:hypothetical protein ABK046_50320, partial [Streptomyces caeruleatus]